MRYHLEASVPVVANAFALVDALLDIAELVRARMVLRPVLHLTRQKLRRNPRANLGAVFLEILEGHLHANLRG
ncbi:hypothetical protein, partial [Pseudomonas taiwanensis]|uniref:hypothetical protein n=1 Tax=Pseudomonas taiwanensis TaxID=470150 RepID=UPI0012DE18EA